MLKKNRGRPLGFRLSDESRKAISDAKKGQHHSEDTKDKISRTLMMYFKNIHPLSQELYDEYGSLLEDNKDFQEWFENVSSDLDASKNVLTERSLNSKRLREISIEYNVNMSDNQHVASFIYNPEKMCELRMICAKKGIDMKAALLLLDIYNSDIVDLLETSEELDG